MSSTETFPVKVEPTLTERSFLEGEAKDSVPAKLSAARFIVDLVEPLPEAILERVAVEAANLWDREAMEAFTWLRWATFGCSSSPTLSFFRLSGGETSEAAIFG
jgi:hypothetical protein